MQPRGKKNFPVNFKGLVSQYSSIQPHWQKIPGKFDFHFLTDYLFLLLLESVFSILSNFLALLSMFSLQNFYEVESRYEFPSSFPPSLLPSFTSFRAGKCLYYLFLSFSFLCFPFWVRWWATWIDPPYLTTFLSYFLSLSSKFICFHHGLFCFQVFLINLPMQAKLVMASLKGEQLRTRLELLMPMLGGGLCSTITKPFH